MMIIDMMKSTMKCRWKGREMEVVGVVRRKKRPKKRESKKERRFHLLTMLVKKERKKERKKESWLVLWHINHWKFLNGKSCLYIYEVRMISFQAFFVWELLLIVHTWNCSLLRSNLLWMQCTCYTVPTTSGRLHRSPLVWAYQWLLSQPLSSPQSSHNDSLWALGITKSQGARSGL